jgi:hypothetical protein
VQQTESFLRQAIPAHERELKRAVALARSANEQKNGQLEAQRALSEQQAREHRKREEEREAARRESSEQQLRDSRDQARRYQAETDELTRQAEIERRRLEEAKKVEEEAHRQGQAQKDKLEAIRKERQETEERARRNRQHLNRLESPTEESRPKGQQRTEPPRTDIAPPDAPTVLLRVPLLRPPDTYRNRDGETVPRPSRTPDGSIPPGATARCRDGAYSFSRHRSGTCSGHGGVVAWIR